MAVQTVTTLEEYKQILASNNLVVVDFHASWCGPCKMIAPKVVIFSERYPAMKFIKIDVDEVSDVAELEEVRAMPTFKIFLAGKMVEEVVGADPSNLENAIKKYN